MSNVRSLILATRPKTLPASIGPIAVALTLAYSVTRQFDPLIFLSALLTFLSLQIAVNIFNDVLDFKKGADTEERLGFKRVTQSGIFSPQQVTLFGTLFLSLAFITALPMIAKGGLPIAYVTLASAVGAYIYTGGPFPLAYHGLGELFVLLFYGFAAVLSLSYIETKEVTAAAFLAAVQIGIYVTAIITMNNMRDIVEDGKSNKRTLAVRLGESKFKCVIAFCLLSPYILGIFWIGLDRPLSFFVPLILLPVSCSFMWTVYKTPPSRAYNGFLAKCALLQLTFGALLSLSFLL